ncbi:MAG: DEAD/DEAH box helicase [Deltaproteobacteria bacterium]
MNRFKQLGLGEPILKAIEDLGFLDPSDVQEKTIPILLNKRTDLVALAQTGTGKTAAFGFPLIQKIDPKNKKTQALILAPTRELCLQITNELKLYSKHIPEIFTVAVYGGASITEQSRNIKKGAHIIVATPGRMQDMQNRNLVNIREIDFCILDEADEMLNMGFYEDITSILAETPSDKSTWLFSATMMQEVAAIAKEFMNNPIEITIGNKNQGPQSVSHEFYLIQAKDRYLALKRLADANPDIFSVVFCRTKKDTQEIADKLIEDGYNAAALHGDLSQAQRDAVMKSFRSRQIRMLVATDVAARGIDVEDITHVINYQLPDEIEVYTHRSGRTGRAGKSGTSMVIISKSELRKINAIERLIKQKFEEKPIPSGFEICEVQLFHLANKINDVEINHEIDTYLPVIFDVFKKLSKEDLIKKMVSVEFNRFLNYYKNADELTTTFKKEKTSLSLHSSNETDGSLRYFINLGSRDNFDWKRLKDFLTAMLDLERDDVYKVDVKESFSFFNTDPEHKEKVLSCFQNFKFEGRRVTAEISKTDKSGRSRENKKDYGDKMDKGNKSRKDRKKNGQGNINFSKFDRSGKEKFKNKSRKKR